AADEQRGQVDVRHTARQIGAEGRKGQQLQYQWSKQEVEKAQTNVCEVGQPTATHQRECDRCQKDEQDNHAYTVRASESTRSLASRARCTTTPLAWYNARTTVGSNCVPVCFSISSSASSTDSAAR